MPDRTHGLSRRERQIMDLLYRTGRATAGEIMAGLPGNPTSSTVRTQLRVLERKGHVRHAEDGHRYAHRGFSSVEDAARGAPDRVASPGRDVLRGIGGEGCRRRPGR